MRANWTIETPASYSKSLAGYRWRDRDGREYCHYSNLEILNLDWVKYSVKMATRDDDDDRCLDEYQFRYQQDLLDGKVAVITGGGSGIGFRITELFMRHGCRTVIASRNMKKLEQVSNEATSCSTAITTTRVQRD